MHALRHFYASALLEAGTSIRAVADYLGHQDPTTAPSRSNPCRPEAATRPGVYLDGLMSVAAAVVNARRPLSSGTTRPDACK